MVGRCGSIFTFVLDFQKLSADYQLALLRQVVPFWLKYGRDEPCGGYFDQLSATGGVIEGDKFISLQAQQVGTFAWLYNTLDGQAAWLDHARHGGVFLSQFAHDDTLNVYARLDRRGRPVAPTSDCVPDCYVVMAYAQLYRATADDAWAMLAKQTFSTLLQRRTTHRNEQAQTIGSFLQLQHLSEPVAVLDAVLAMQPLLDESAYQEATEAVLDELLREFVDRRTDTLREFVLPEGAFVNTPEGRRLNVGLTFQTASLLLNYCVESGNRKLAVQVTAWCLRLCEQAWDDGVGGLNAYVDMKGQPAVFSDWQQKWAWVQLEAINALTKGYCQTRQTDCLKWFKRVHDHTFAYFPDPKQAGWQLVIDANKQPLLPAKAITEVGCFSQIRCLAETAQALTKCEQVQPTGPSLRMA